MGNHPSSTLPVVLHLAKEVDVGITCYIRVLPGIFLPKSEVFLSTFGDTAHSYFESPEAIEKK